MRLIFLYVRDRKAAYFAERFREEGYCLLIEEMIKAGIIDSALAVIHGKKTTAVMESYLIGENFTGKVVEDLDELNGLMVEDDVIFVRGGFKDWHDWVERKGRLNHWLLLYAANTGRARWKFWDIIFDDLGGRDHIDKTGRVFLDFRKPVNEKIFRPLQLSKIYDVCIGASRIHDRKGQWRAVEALAAFKQKFDKDLKAILPGPWARGVKSNKITETIAAHGLDVFISGPLSREELNVVFNMSSCFVHLGSHGQGDRGPMEAMRAGTPVLIGYPKYHSPWLVKDPVSSMVAKKPTDPIQTAVDISKLMSDDQPERRGLCFNYQRFSAGIREVSIPRMKRIFDFIRDNPKKDRAGILDVL